MATGLRKLMRMGLAVSRGEVELVSLVDSVPPDPLGFIAFLLLQQKDKGRTAFGWKTARPLLLFAGSRSALGSLPSVALPSAGAKDGFPVCVSFRVYREGNGKRQFELVTPGVTDDFALSGKFG